MKLNRISNYFLQVNTAATLVNVIRDTTVMGWAPMAAKERMKYIDNFFKSYVDHLKRGL